jgi:molecular chaperone DnaK
MPYLRQVLPDTKEGLGIPLEFGIDPLTVVAQGAALFAGGAKTH